MADNQFEARIDKTSPVHQSIVPAALRGSRFDFSRALDMRVGRWSWTAVPTKDALGQGKELDVHAIVNDPTRWLLIKGGELNTSQGLELDVRPRRERGKVNVRVLRSSGRVVAEGTAQATDQGVDFDVQVVGVRMPGRRRKQRTVVRGTLSKEGRLRMKMGAVE